MHLFIKKKHLELNNIAYTTDKNDLKYDILHINTIWPDSFKMINQAKENNKKIVYHAHSTEEDFRNSFMFSNSISGMYRKWLINLYSKADHIITPTEYSKQLFDACGLLVPISAISNGIDLKQFNPQTDSN